MSNPIEKPLQNYFQRLTTLNGVLHVIKSQSEIALSRLKRHESDAAQALPIWYGSRVLLEDIGDIPSDLWRRFRPTEHVFVIHHEDAEEAFADILERINLFIVSQAYEAYETFLFDSVAYLHHSQPATADKRKLKEWANKGNGYPSTVEDWCRYVRGRDTYRGKNNSKLLRWIRNLAPQVEKVENEKQNTLRVNLQDWFAAATEGRHAATHSNGLVKTERVRLLSRQKQAVLRSYFAGVNSPDGYVLHLDTESAGRALQVFHSYAYAIHKSLSIEHDQVPAYASDISQ